MRRATWILIVTTVILNVVAQAYSIPVTRYIRDSSTSVNADIALRFAYFAFMLITAAVEALLFDDLVSGGSWRKRFFGGIRADRGMEPVVDRDEDAARLSDEEFDAALGSRRSGVRSLIAQNSLLFFIAFFLLLGLNLVLFNALNGWFDVYYGRGGHFVTQLRSKDVDERCKAILELSYKRSSRMGLDLEKVFADRLERGTAKEKVWAAWALGYRRKLKLPGKPIKQLERAEDLLVRLLDKGTPRQQRIAVVAAARYARARGDDSSAALLPALRNLVVRQEAADRIPVETVVALGLLREKPAVELLGGLLLSPDEKRAVTAAWALGRMQHSSRAVTAAWALGRMQHSSALRPLLAALDKAAPNVRCAIVRAFQKLGHAARVSGRLMDQFNRKTSDFHCGVRQLVLRPDGRGTKIVDRLPLARLSDRYRVLLLKTMAKVSFLEDALPWLKRVSQDQAFHKQVRGYAREYYRLLQLQLAREQ
jgi:hypothetical protein